VWDDTVASDRSLFDDFQLKVNCLLFKTEIIEFFGEHMLIRQRCDLMKMLLLNISGGISLYVVLAFG